MADHGTGFKTRFKPMCGRVAAIKAIWTAAEREFHGEFVDFPQMNAWPKPVQNPRPPVIGYSTGEACRDLT
jgi:alkanesulfonate monooxygenase SsuD/methylene tetrahydromethanopterin reductase-like flavin-dependent oxidoreductase (luciferase family)